MRRYLVPVLLMAVFSGCMSVGRPFPGGRAVELKVGVTTKAEVARSFGEPWRYGIEDGHTTWTYARYRYSVFSPAQTEDLVVRFDAKGVVSSFSYSATRPRE